MFEAKYKGKFNLASQPKLQKNNEWQQQRKGNLVLGDSNVKPNLNPFLKRFVILSLDKVSNCCAARCIVSSSDWNTKTLGHHF